MNVRTGGAGLTLRRAALITGFAYLLNPVSYAEFALWPKLMVAGNVEQTVANVAAHHDVFGVFFAFFVNFIEDIIIAWALYFLLAPVNKALSLLASLFQLVYAAICFAGLFNLLAAYRMSTTPEFLSAFGHVQLHAQIDLLLHWFRYDYSMALVVFAIHLLLVGALIIRSRYIPAWLGVILVIDGLGWIVTMLEPYLYPNVNAGYVAITAIGELVFMLWLLIMGWRIPEPVEPSLSHGAGPAPRSRATCNRLRHTPANPLSVSPQAVEMDAGAEGHLFMVMSSAKIAAFSEQDTCKGIASVALAASGEAAATYTVKPLGAGTCSAAIRDQAGNTITVPNTVR